MPCNESGVWVWSFPAMFIGRTKTRTTEDGKEYFSAWSGSGATVTRFASRLCLTWAATLPWISSTGPCCANGSRSFCRGRSRFRRRPAQRRWNERRSAAQFVGRSPDGASPPGSEMHSVDVVSLEMVARARWVSSMRGSGRVAGHRLRDQQHDESGGTAAKDCRDGRRRFRGDRTRAGAETTNPSLTFSSSQNDPPTAFETGFNPQTPSKAS